MKRVISFATALALGLTTGVPAVAAPAEQRQPEASIPFVNHGGVRDWQADGRETLYIQGRNRQWYKATLMSPAHDLPFAWAIGFDTGPMNRLDKFSSVIVRGQRYPIVSLVKVDAPPPAREKARRQVSRDEA